MRLILSGEGPTDIGHEVPTAAGLEFVPGPMAWVVDKLLERHHTNYSMLSTHAAGADCVTYVHETQLAALGKTGSPLLPGIKFGRDTAYFTRSAQVMGLMANQTAAQQGQPVIPVLFRDGDGTRSTPAGEWQAKVDSMHRGFALVECETGVPMVPRPKSEAWLLCALRPPTYTNCGPLEDAPGNDASPNALKRQLQTLCGGHMPSAQDQADWVSTGVVDPLQINMPSFNTFRQALHNAATRAGLPTLP